MNQTLRYSEVVDMLPAYVLGALEPDEMLAVESYLQDHRLLVEQLQRSEESAAWLALAAPAIAPPPAAKQGFMARVRQTAIRPALTAAAPPEVVGAPKPANPLLRRAASSAPLASTLLPAPARRPPSRRFNWGWAAAAAGAGGGLVTVVVASTLYQGRVDALQQELARRDQQLQAAHQQIEALQQQFDGAQNQLAAFENPTRVVALTGTEAAPQISGAFIQKDRAGVIVVSGLQPLASDQSYQLWLIPAEGAPAPAGLLEGVAAGSTVQGLTIPTGAEDYANVGISIEPAGGSPAPTGPIVALG
jgi:anti-sigma-K factor RskA